MTQNSPSELVSKYFPDAPDACLECPGLIAAAEKNDRYAGISSKTVESGPQRGFFDDPKTQSIAHIVGVALSSLGERSVRASLPIAKELYENCGNGPFVHSSEEEVIVQGTMEDTSPVEIKTTAYTFSVGCTSASPVAAFIGEQSVHRGILSTPVEE